jgi:hypothetical protein
MPGKIKSIVLSDGHEFMPNEERWQVEQLGNTMEFRTGDLLDKHQVKRLCDSGNWKVTIKRTRSPRHV